MHREGPIEKLQIVLFVMAVFAAILWCCFALTGYITYAIYSIIACPSFMVSIIILDAVKGRKHGLQTR